MNPGELSARQESWRIKDQNLEKANFACSRPEGVARIYPTAKRFELRDTNTTGLTKVWIFDAQIFGEVANEAIG